jgi:hypothetical protein
MNQQQVEEIVAKQNQQWEQRLAAERAQMQKEMADTVAAQIEASQTRAMLAEQEARFAREEQIRATQLLQAAVTNMGGTRPASSSATDEMVELRSVIDVKMLDRLESFDGQDAHWENWLTGFEALTGLIGLNTVMVVASQPGITAQECLLNALGGDDVRLKAKALWYLLTQACRGKARNLVKKSEKFNGVHAWKILFDEYRPRMAGRFNAMLMGLFSPDWNNGSPFLDSLAAWDVE